MINRYITKKQVVNGQQFHLLGVSNSIDFPWKAPTTEMCTSNHPGLVQAKMFKMT